MNGVVALRLGHAVEPGRRTHGVGTHVSEDEPVSSVQLRQQALLLDAVESVTGRPPDAARVTRNAWLGHLGSHTTDVSTIAVPMYGIIYNDIILKVDMLVNLNISGRRIDYTQVEKN